MIKRSLAIGALVLVFLIGVIQLRDYWTVRGWQKTWLDAAADHHQRCDPLKRMFAIQLADAGLTERAAECEAEWEAIARFGERRGWNDGPFKFEMERDKVVLEWDKNKRSDGRRR